MATQYSVHVLANDFSGLLVFLESHCVRLWSSFGTKGLFIEIVSPLYAVETAVPKSVINLDKDFFM